MIHRLVKRRFDARWALALALLWGVGCEPVSDGSPPATAADGQVDTGPTPDGDVNDGSVTPPDMNLADARTPVADAMPAVDASPTAICGDGVTDPDEACDDGNTVTEACAYGETACEVCAADCTLQAGETETCGDGTLNGEEDCDHGPANGGRSCDAECALVPCGMLDYRPVSVQGWRACLAGPFERTDPALSQEVLDALDEDLAYIVTLLPAHALPFLKTVTIWIEQAHPEFIAAVYHPSPIWLRENGYPPEWGEAVMLGNARNYLDWTAEQPAMVLHELSHAWHHQHLTYQYGPIRDAYARAMAAGLYDDVPYVLGGTQRAYATTDQMEFFAELTEAWFWQNDFYPFDRDDLREHDPESAQVIQDAWAP